MSFVVLQRVVVRMLFDLQFAQAVIADPDASLSALDLRDDERRWLAETDPRAWRLDPMRRSRTLRALLACTSARRSVLSASARTASYRWPSARSSVVCLPQRT